MSLLTPIAIFDNFKAAKDISEAAVTSDLIDAVQALDEREELEPFIRNILVDLNQTPHGPAEIVDIFTHKVSLRGRPGMGAFILKGKSFKTVRPADVSHQIYRLKKIDGLSYAFFASAGTVLDAAKEQFCSTCEELGINYSILGAVELVQIFVAYGFLCPRDGNVISSGRCRCGYSPQKRILNLLQQEALEGLSNAHKCERKSGLVVLPPGSGKTRIAAEDALRSGAKRILYVAHTHEILDVAESEFAAKFSHNHVCRSQKSSDLQNLKRVTISTIQLIAENLGGIPKEKFDYIVIDEFHHAAATSYRQLIEHSRSAFILGLTGTPFRADGQNIAQLCNNVIVVSYELRFGIESGVLCPYHYFGCFDDIDYTNITHNGSIYSIYDLEHALLIPKRDKAIIKKWQDKAEGKPTIAFCCTIKHATRVAVHFKAAGISAAVYTSKTPKAERGQIISRFKDGDISVLCVVDVLNEGADLPFVECLLFLRPLDSRSKCDIGAEWDIFN